MMMYRKNIHFHINNFEEEMKDGIVVFGFAGIGKSTLCKNTNNKKFLDLESSNFQWILNDEQKLLPVEQRKGLIFQKNPDWPDNYAKAIIDVRNKYDFIFVAHEGKIQCQIYKKNEKSW